MKILYLDLNIKYHNPTRNLIPLLLKSIADELDIFGPGYVHENILYRGIDEFVEQNGPYDFVCSNEHISIFFNEKYKKENMKYINNFFFKTFSFTSEILISIEKMNKFFTNYQDSKKLLFLLEFDYYWINRHKLDLIDATQAFIIGFGNTFIAPLDEMPDLKKETFADKANDNWYNYINKNTTKIIDLPHFVSPDEFSFLNIENRRYDITVLGAGYWNRKQALYFAEKDTRLKVYKNFHNKIFYLLHKTGLPVYSNSLMISFYNLYFKYIMEQSLMSYTCGSALRWPIRKFFEIPSKGAVLLATPYKGFTETGFIDKKNCIIVHENDLNMINDIVYYYKSNLEELGSIAKHANSFIWKTHSLEARSKQLAKVCFSIINDQFAGSYWKEGKFYVQKK